jgi:hypothetical protein
MPSDRILRQVQRLLDEVEEHVEQGEWSEARTVLARVLALDPENVDGIEYRRAVDRAAPGEADGPADDQAPDRPPDLTASETGPSDGTGKPVTAARARTASTTSESGTSVPDRSVAPSVPSQVPPQPGVNPAVTSRAEAGWRARAAAPQTWVALGLGVSLVGVLLNWESGYSQWQHAETQLRDWSEEFFDRSLINLPIGGDSPLLLISEDTAVATLLLLSATWAAIAWRSGRDPSFRWLLAGIAVLLGALALLERRYISDHYELGPGLYFLLAGSVMVGLGALLPTPDSTQVPHQAQHTPSRRMRSYLLVSGGVVGVALILVAVFGAWLSGNLGGGDRVTPPADSDGVELNGSGVGDGGVSASRPDYFSRLATLSPAINDPEDLAIVIRERHDGSRTASMIARSGDQLLIELPDETAGDATSAPVHLFHDGFEIVAFSDPETRTFSIELYDHVAGDSAAITLTLLSGRALLRTFDSAGSPQAVDQQMFEFADYPELAQLEDLLAQNRRSDRLVSSVWGDVSSAPDAPAPRQETVMTSLEVTVIDPDGALIDDDLELQLVVEFPLTIFLKDGEPWELASFLLSEEMWSAISPPGRYIGEIETFRPMDGIRLARACAQAVDTVSTQSRGIGWVGTILGLAPPPFGPVFSLTALALSEWNGWSGNTAVQCIDLGARAESLLDEQVSARSW